MPRRRRFASSAGAGLHDSAIRATVTGSPVINVTTVGGTTVVTSSGALTGSYTANSEVIVGDLVELESADTVRKARPDAADPARLVGFCSEKTGDTCEVQYGGEFTVPQSMRPLTVDGVYFARNLGAISTTPPLTGALSVVGTARSSSTLLITIAEPIHLS